MERVIRVKGRGKLSVSPDTIQLNLNLKDVHKDYEETIKASSKDTETVKECIVKAGLAKKDVKTTYFNVDTYYESYHDKKGNYKSKFAGYEYRHDMHIKFPNDNKILSKVLTALSKSKLPIEFSIKHTVKDIDKVKNELLAKAIEDSKEKAVVLAKASGVTLGDIITIDYSWVDFEVSSRPMNALYNSFESKLWDTDEMDLEVDDIDVEDNVMVVWEIK